MASQVDITADAIALQERDEFRAQGWVKLIAPAKVNLRLAIGARRPDGYHRATTVLHALNLHDVVYMRRKTPEDDSPGAPTTRLVACGDVAVPDLPSEDNIATKAVARLAGRLGVEDAGIMVRIEKNIPLQGGLGGGSSDAAAALVGAAHLWGVDASCPEVVEVARALGIDVAFFLQGGCSLFVGAGDEFAGRLEPSKKSIVLVKPEFGISTPEAYRVFDERCEPVDESPEDALRGKRNADDIGLFNNLAYAAEVIEPQLADIKMWLGAQQGVQATLLCGSGATTFAVCSDFAAACRVVAEARKLGFWARATSLGSTRAMVVST